MTAMLSVSEAQARLLALAGPLPLERVGLVEAAGRHLAAPIVAQRHQPAADLSAMDGYALRFADLPGPWSVVGESAAGRGLDRAIGAGEAARIFTGAPVPQGADTILLQEEATRDSDTLRLSGAGPANEGQSIRIAGSDFSAGATLIEAGSLLTPARIALAAMAGHGAVEVRHRPRVAILSTGDELVPAGEIAPPPLLPASNGPMLAALLAGCQAEAIDRGIVPDQVDLLAAAFTEAAADADVIVTTGGVSVGDHDLVRPTLESIGADLDFWRVAMRPGKPLMAGRIGQTIVLGLPGNPISAFVTAHLFLLPLLRHLAGDPAPLPETVTLPLEAPIAATRNRADYLRARRTANGVAPFASRDSALLTELASADALIVRQPLAPAAEIGDFCEVLLLY